MSLKTDREKAAHLLRRFALGASEAELDYYLQSGGLNGAIQKLLDYEKIEDGFQIEIDELQPAADRPVPMPAVVAWWSSRILYTRRPLEEKLTLFWHDHFATSAEKVKAAPIMFQQNQVIRKHALGNFREMLHAVSKDPAMVFWLDNQYNVKGKPNENFAREVMELFTLGIGHYTEKDVQEAARAFTGWGLGRGPNAANRGANAVRPNTVFVFRPFQHDAGEKTVLGKSGPLTGEDVLDHLCSLERTGKYLVTKLWEWFAYPKPEPKLVQRLTDTFRKSDLNIRTLVEAMMKSPEFYSQKAERAIYKTPVDFVAAAARQLGLGEIVVNAMQISERAAVAPGAQLSQTMKNMGMWLFYPPDVAGWEGGSSWISTATMLERIRFADTLFGTGASKTPNRARFGRFNGYNLLQGAKDSMEVARKLVSLLDAPIPPQKLPALAAAAKQAGGDELSEENANQVAAAVTRLIFASPEFQFA